MDKTIETRIMQAEQSHFGEFGMGLDRFLEIEIVGYDYYDFKYSKYRRLAQNNFHEFVEEMCRLAHGVAQYGAIAPCFRNRQEDDDVTVPRNWDFTYNGHWYRCTHLEWKKVRGQKALRLFIKGVGHF